MPYLNGGTKSRDKDESTLSEWLFVNSKTGGKTREARTHVVLRRKRQKKAHAVIRIQPRETRLSATSRETATTSRSLVYAIDESNESQCSLDSEKRDHLKSSTQQNNVRTLQVTRKVIQRATSTSNHGVISPFDILRRGQPDPFDTTAIKIAPVMIDLLQYSQRWYIDMKWALGGILRRHSHSTEAWTADMRNAICEKTSLYASLAVGCLFASSMSSNPAPSTPFLPGLHYKVLSLMSVREKFENGFASASMVQAIMDLAAADLLAVDYRAAYLHLHAAKTMIDTLGGLGKMTESIRDSVGLTDYVLSWMMLSKPLFRYEEWDPGPLEAQIPGNMQEPHCLDQPPVLLFGPDQKTKLDTNMLDVELPTIFLRAAFSELRVVVFTRQQINTIVRPHHAINRTLRWVHIRTTALYVGLLHHYLDNADLAQTHHNWTSNQRAEQQLAAAICLAARYCHSLVTYSVAVIVQLFPILKVHEELKTALLGLGDEVFCYRRHLALWLYFVAAVVEELAGQYGDEEGEGTQRAKFGQAVGRLWSTSREDVKNVLCGFIYAGSLDGYLDKYLKG